MQRKEEHLKRAAGSTGASAFARFKDLTRLILRISKDEVNEKRKECDERQAAHARSQTS